MNRGWLALVVVGSVLALCLAQTNIQPIELIIMVDDSPGVGDNNWRVTMEFMKNVVAGAKQLLEAETWKLGIVTFSGREIVRLQSGASATFDNLIDQASYQGSTNRAGWNLVSSMLRDEGRQGIASVVVIMPSSSLQYSQGEVTLWAESLTNEFHSFRLIVGLGLDASSASFFRSQSTTDPIDGTQSFLETSYNQLQIDSTQNNIIERLYKAATHATPPEGPEDCLNMDLVFVIDERTAPFVNEVREFIKNTLRLITNKQLQQVAVGFVSVGSEGTLLRAFRQVDYSDMNAEVDRLFYQQSNTADLGRAIPVIRSMLDDARFDRSLEPEVIVFITYREPDIRSLQQNLLSFDLAFASIIAVGVETSATTLNSIATVTAWRSLVPSMSVLPDYGGIVRERICAAAIPVCFYAADVALVVDAGSLQAVNNWESIKNLVKDIVQSYFYGYNGVRFAIVLYGDNAQLEYNLQDSMGDKYPKLAQFAQQIDGLRSLSLTFSPNPAAAFRVVREQVFSSNVGNRDNRNVVLWIPSAVTSQMDASLQSEVVEMKREKLAVGVIGLALSQEGVDIANNFASSVAADDMTYFVSDYNTLQAVESRVRIIFDYISPIICRVYKTNFEGGPGVKGDPGPPGIVGPDGPPGVQGQNGEPGPRGPNGDIGNPGGPGIKGIAGDPGNPGPIGPNGDPGRPGSPGQQGDIGLQGNPGNPGSNGLKGRKGEQGPSAAGRGEKGDPGFGNPGSPGIRGDPGDQGRKGSAAGRGQKGQRGPDGEKGNPGRLGLSGNPGLNGSPGNDGSRGQIGDKGNAGSPGFGGAGPKGIRGDNGSPGSPGIFGNPGNKGAKGEPGPNGIPGSNGAKGDRGNPGRNGSPGVNGGFGEKGAPGGGGVGNPGRPGVKGDSGVQGFQGPNGLPGNNGIPGDKGERGIPGDPGLSGGNGVNGIKGERGDLGSPGAPGNPGAPGQGFQGPKGDRGDSGQPGTKGQRGSPGGQGIKGIKGQKGENGIQGNFGRQGGRGAPGFNGLQGAKGNQGVNGQSFVGQKGEKGFQGNPGTPGSDGRPGNPGNPGTPGPKGSKGNLGNPGNPGANGNQGLQGSPGLNGDRGSQGVRGDAGGGFPGRPGIDGSPGVDGLRGTDGVPGVDGVKGEQGDRGLSAGPGLTGEVGEQGDRGSPGFGGVPGSGGDTGNTGGTGFTGDRGNNGNPGNRGLQGPKGVVGRVGPVGPQGIKGLSGNSVRGPDGDPGPQGPEGPEGPPGTGGVSYVDECRSFNPCTQKCVDTYDSYYCACDEGYELTGGQIDCSRQAGKRKKRQASNNCQNNVLDMVLLIDTSAWNFEYNDVVQTIERFLNAAGFCNTQSSMRVAVVTFGAQPNMIHSFSDGQTFDAVKTKLGQTRPSAAYDNNPVAAFQQLATWTSPGGQLAPRSNAQLIIGFFTTYGFYALADATIAAANGLKNRGTNPATIFAYGVKYAIESELSEVASNDYFAKAAEYDQFANAVSSAVAGNPVFQGGIVDPTTPPVGPGGDCFGADLDVAILVDVSWWVGSFSDFTSEISKFVSSFPSCNSETVRFAVVSYTQDDARLESQLTRNVDQVKSTLEGLEFRGTWDVNLQPALTVADTQVFSQSTSANKLILVLSARNQDGLNMADLKRKYTIAAYGFKRGAEDQGWLSNVPSNDRLRFASPDPNVMSLASDLRPLAGMLQDVMGIETPLPVGPDPLDLVLILDASGSTDVNFNAMKQFLKDVIENLNVGNNNVRIGLVRFSQTASVPFGLTRYNSLQDVVSAIDQVQRIGGRTNIAASLRTTDNLFETQGRSNAPHVALIITDGYANEEIARTVYDASILRSKGVHVLGVQVSDPRMLMNQMVPLESITTSFEYVYKYGSHRELRERMQRINVMKGIVQLGYIDYDVAPQPETYYCRDTIHGNMCFCRETPYRPINGSQCIDIDECQHNNGGCEQRCQNNRGSFTCACESGFQLSDDKRTCLDVDECQGSQVCTPNTMCINHAGGFVCVEPQNTDPQTGAMVGNVVTPTVSAGIIVAISLGAAVGTVALAVALALVGRAIVRRGEDEQEEHVESLPTPSASSSTYGTVRSKLSMAHSENKAAL